MFGQIITRDYYTNNIITTVFIEEPNKIKIKTTKDSTLLINYKKIQNLNFYFMIIQQ